MDNAGLLGKITDHQRPDTVASRLRQRRYEFFRSLATSVERPLKILDVGGTQTIWERIGFADQQDIHAALIQGVRKNGVVAGKHRDLFAGGVHFSNAVHCQWLADAHALL